MSRHRRSTFWLGKTLGYQAVGTGTISQVLATSAEIHETTEAPTLIRIVGRICFWFERDDFVESMRSTCFAGIQCVHEDLPNQNPLSAVSEENWMWQGLMTTQATFSQAPIREFDSQTLTNGTTTRYTQHVPTGTEHVDLDIRAMRKAPLPCEVRLALDITERMSNTGASHKITALVRMLFKA